MKRIIAYLAPEIPALSATFVYNEILNLYEQGYEIVPISVHVPTVATVEPCAEALRRKTHYLYCRGLIDFLSAALIQSFFSPRNFFNTITSVLCDAHTLKFSRAGIGLFYRFLAACRVARILCKREVEHLHAHFAHVPTDIAMYAASMAGISYSFTAHANDLFERGWLLREKISRSKFTITISDFNKRFMLGQGGCPGKVHVIHCGIDTIRFCPATTTQRKPKPPYVIGSLGRMVEKKGFDVLLKTVNILINNGLNIRLIIAGNGPLEQKLKAIANELELISVVEFPGPINHEQVSAWLKTLDLFVLPCQQDDKGDMDGIPVVLMEAMASGVPVVSTNISGIPELIKNEVDGLLVSPEGGTLLVDSITRLLIDDNLRNRCVNNARNKIQTTFEQRNIAKKISSLIEEMLEE